MRTWRDHFACKTCNLVARQGLLCREPQKSDVCASVRPSVHPPYILHPPSANCLTVSGPCFESNLLAQMVFSGLGLDPSVTHQLLSVFSTKIYNY